MKSIHLSQAPRQGKRSLKYGIRSNRKLNQGSLDPFTALPDSLSLHLPIFQAQKSAKTSLPYPCFPCRTGDLWGDDYLLIGFAIISRITISKIRVEFAGLITKAVSAPPFVPAMPITSLSMAINPASAAIATISTATFVP